MAKKREAREIGESRRRAAKRRSTARRVVRKRAPKPPQQARKAAPKPPRQARKAAPKPPRQARKAAPKPPQQARSRETRRRVVDAAIACFERHGFEETTTAMIAERAGVAVGTVYNYFVDKRALILELLAETDREQAEPVVAGLDPASWRGRRDPRDITRALIDAIFQAQSRRPGIQRILWARYFKDPDFEAPFEAVRARIRQAIVEFIDAVDEQGLLRAGVDRAMAPFVILNAVQWNASQAYFRGDARFLDAAAAATAEMVALYLFRDAGAGRGRGRRSRAAAGVAAKAAPGASPAGRRPRRARVRTSPRC